MIKQRQLQTVAYSLGTTEHHNGTTTTAGGFLRSNPLRPIIRPSERSEIITQVSVSD